VLLLVACAFFLNVSAVTPPYKICSTATAHLKIYTVDVDPWPPVSGQPLYVNMTGAVDEDVSSGNYAIDVKLDGVPLPAITGDIDHFKPLPWNKGNISMSFEQDIPGGILKGTTCSLQISAVEQNNQQLFCIDLSFVFQQSVSSLHFPVIKSPKGSTQPSVLQRLVTKLHMPNEHRHHQ